MKHKEKFLIYMWLGALIVILGAGIFLCFQRPSVDIIKSCQELTTTAEKIRAFYRNRPDYWGLNNTTAMAENLYDGKTVNEKIQNSLGKEIIIGADSQGNQVMPGARSFMITYKKLNKQECAELAAFKGKDQDKLGLIFMSIRNQAGTYDFSWGNKGLPLTKNQAKKYCNEENDIMWSFE